MLGVATIDGDADIEGGIRTLGEARKKYFACAMAEGRAAVLVALGDACWRGGHRDRARKSYRQALKSRRGMDNADAITVAATRLTQLANSWAPEPRAFIPK